MKYIKIFFMNLKNYKIKIILFNQLFFYIINIELIIFLIKNP